jgi:hypothetical protein
MSLGLVLFFKSRARAREDAARVLRGARCRAVSFYSTPPKIRASAQSRAAKGPKTASRIFRGADRHQRR